MTFLFPLGAAAAGALVPLIVLYLLKQKRAEYRVPTNFLWARALEDLRASSLFQRLRTQLLLLLQALAVILFALAAAGASLELDLGERPRRVILVVDRSRSMKAADEDGSTRFKVAQELARDAVSSLRGGDEIMLIAFDSTAEVVQSFTSDTDRLDAAIDGLSPRDLPSHAADAMLLVQPAGQASSAFDVEVVLLTDGALSDALPDVAYPVQYQRIGKSDANQGIGAAYVTRQPAEPAQLFVRVDNGGAEPATRRVVLSRGADVLDARDVQLDGGADRTVFFELPDPPGGDPVIFHVSLDGSDVLGADDHVDLVLRPQVARNGLLVANEPSIYLDVEKLTGLHPGLALTAVSMADAQAAFTTGTVPIDLVIFDGVAPSEVPPVPAQLYVNCIPPGSNIRETGRQEYPIIIDWDRMHPTTVRCLFDDVQVIDAMRLAGTERSRTLVDSTGGPLVLLTPVPGREVVMVAFSPAQSNLPLKLAWPLFLANTMDFLLAGVERAGEEAVVATGTPLVVADEGPFTVSAPDGRDVLVEPDAKGRAQFGDTWNAGVYEVTTATRTKAPYAVALLDPVEIRLAPRAELTLGEHPVQAATTSIARHMLLRDPLLLLALALLVLEWAVWCGRR